MPETPISLLERLRHRPDDISWRRLVDLYRPLIRGWLASHLPQAADIDDLEQDVMKAIIVELPRFEHNRRSGAFRRWLRTVAVNRLRWYWRDHKGIPRTVDSSAFDRILDQLADSESELSRQWDRDHDRHVVRRMTELIRGDFEPATWQAFHRVVIEGERAAAVAASLHISVNSVLLAKSRVLRRLRDEVQGLTD